MSGFDIGDRLRLSATFTKRSDGSPAPPDAVVLTVEAPDHTVSMIEVEGDEETAVYTGIVEPDASGWWHYRFAGTGENMGAEEGSFKVRPRRVPDPD